MMRRFSSSSISYSSTSYYYNEEGIPVHKDDYKAPVYVKSDSSKNTAERPKRDKYVDKF